MPTDRPRIYALPFTADTDPLQRERALIAALYGNETGRGRAVLELDASRRLQPDGAERSTHVGTLTIVVHDIQPVEGDPDRMYFIGYASVVSPEVERDMGLVLNDWLSGYLWPGRPGVWFRREELPIRGRTGGSTSSALAAQPIRYTRGIQRHRTPRPHPRTPQKYRVEN